VTAGVRKALGVPVTAATVFGARTVAALAARADALAAEARQQEEAEESWSGDESLDESAGGDCGDGAGGAGGGGGARRGARRGGVFSEIKFQARLRPRSATRAAALAVQAVPLALLYPLRRVATWVLFVALWIGLQRQPQLSRLQALVGALALERLAAGLALPLVGVAAKWLIIGRYRAGAYPLWGSYYLRWWLVDQTLQVCGRGLFRHSRRALNWYYRSLGARIGAGAAIHPQARLAEHDLVSIGAGAAIDNVAVRAFSLGAGAMRLEPLHVGVGATVAAKVALVPGVPVPDFAALPPLSSSYDLLGTAPPPGGPGAAAQQCTMRFPAPGPAYRALGGAVLAWVWLLEQLPVLFVLRAMVDAPWSAPPETCPVSTGGGRDVSG